MKGRESGMPDETMWDSFYDAGCIVEKLGCASSPTGSIAEFGCGYGTFTLPAACRTSGTIHAFDIEADLVALVRRKAEQEGLRNVRAELRDFVISGTGLPPQSMDHVMLFNLLHIEQPVALLAEAHRILKPGGTLSVMHWKHDIPTPRGPSMEIRPSPGQCRAWAEEAGFVFLHDQDLSECCDYHYGLVLTRP